MTEDQVAKFLIEQGGQEGQEPLNKKVSVYLSRLMLRLFSVPSIMANLVDAGHVKDPEQGEGAVKIQLDFMRLPAEIIPQLKRLIAAPGEISLFKYVKNGAAHIGFEIPVKPDDFAGEKYDYAL